MTNARERIHKGEVSERGSARLIGISQPHAHNVLKGARKLSPEIFDSILKTFKMSLLDLAPVEDLEANLKQRQGQAPVPEMGFLEARVGPGVPWPTRVSIHKRFPLPFSAHFTTPGVVAAPRVHS